jgi:hypothetical protein
VAKSENVDVLKGSGKKSDILTIEPLNPPFEVPSMFLVETGMVEFSEIF